MIDFNLLQDFMEEASEHLEEMESSLLKMEESPDNEDILNDIFRSVHTIKGAAQFVGLERISELTHKLENLLDRLRVKELTPTMEIVDLLIAGKDRIAALAREVETHREERAQIDDILSQIEAIDGAPGTPAPTADTREPAAETPVSPSEASGIDGLLDDFFEEPADSDPSALLGSDGFEEEYDAELFDIFIAQLREGIASIQAAVQEGSAGGEPEAMLSRCASTVRRLSAAANYMGYEQLKAFYDRWQEAISSAAQQVPEGRQVPSDLNKPWLQALLERFPGADPTEAPADGGVVSTDADNPSDTGKEGVEELLDDFFDSRSKPSPDDDEGPAALLKGTDFEEEYDAELFSIFQHQMGEGLAMFRQLDAEMASSDDPAAVLTRCRDAIERLSSAANYMGYEPLIVFYGEWLEAVEGALEMAAGGSMPEDVNTPWIQALLSKFPEAAKVAEKAAVDSSAGDAAREKAPDAKPDGEFAEALDLLKSEIIDEEHDAELFDIFIGQLQEGVAGFRRLSTELSTSDNPAGVVSECMETLRRLTSAANYMGYERLSEFYTRWQEILAAAVHRAEDGAAVSDDMIMPWVRALLDKFPEAAGATVPEEDSGAHALIDDLFRAQSAQDIADLLMDEQFEEEYDSELFEIFHEQLLEGVGELRMLTAQLAATDDPGNVLAECDGTLERMSAAANYMGYDKLTEFYSRWREQLSGARTLLQDGEEIPADINDNWLEVLVEKFPGAKSLERADNGHAGGADSGKSDDGETPIGRRHKTPTPQGTDDEEDRLMRELSVAFDNDTSASVDDDEAPIDDVIQQMLSMDNGGLPAFETASDAGETDAGKTLDAKMDPKPPEAKGSKASAGGEGKADIQKQSMTPEEISAEAAAARRSEVEAAPRERVFKQSLRVDADKIDFLMNEVGELVVSRAYFFQLFNEMRMLQQEFKEQLKLDQKELKPLRELTFRLGEASVALGRVSNELQEGVMKVRMLPVSQLFNRYPRLVRDLVHQTDKKVKLEVRGEETELDKMIIEEISDPLIHLIRNAVDHGIEPSAEREALGKRPEGHLLLEAYHESNHIVIEISDDGRGIDAERIRQKALEKGLYGTEELERMTDQDLYRLIMLPGFSTASVATKTSGRGVGMDVVKKNIEKLNGTFEVESEVAKGTMMRIKIPLTLAIIQALMVNVGGDLFTIPLPAIEETMKISKDETTTIEGVEVIHIRETTMPIFRLKELFNMDGTEDESEESFVVIVNAGAQLVGLVVDQLIGQDEVVIKPLADYLREESGFSGATITGDGRVSLILDVHELVKMAAIRNTSRRRTLRKIGQMSAETAAPA